MNYEVGHTLRHAVGQVAVGSFAHGWTTGAAARQDLAPRGSPPPTPTLYTPQNRCMGQWSLWAPEVPEMLFQAYSRGGNFWFHDMHLYSKCSEFRGEFKNWVSWGIPPPSNP